VAVADWYLSRTDYRQAAGGTMLFGKVGPRGRRSVQQAEQGCEVLQPEQVTQTRPGRLWQVVLLDDDEHTYDYVIEMLVELFGYCVERAYQMACEVDATGSVVVETTTLERAEFKRDQIHAYGPDWRLERSGGSMRALLRPAPGVPT
jgi:ATP-dependent Clp protease adaptor protein ClpS